MVWAKSQLTGSLCQLPDRSIVLRLVTTPLRAWVQGNPDQCKQKSVSSLTHSSTWNHVCMCDHVGRSWSHRPPVWDACVYHWHTTDLAHPSPYLISLPYLHCRPGSPLYLHSCLLTLQALNMDAYGCTRNSLVKLFIVKSSLVARQPGIYQEWSYVQACHSVLARNCKPSGAKV